MLEAVLLMLSLIGRMWIDRGWFNSIAIAAMGTMVGAINPNPDWLILAKSCIQIIAWIVAIVAGIISIKKAIKKGG